MVNMDPESLVPAEQAKGPVAAIGCAKPRLKRGRPMTAKELAAFEKWQACAKKWKKGESGNPKGGNELTKSRVIATRLWEKMDDLEKTRQLDFFTAILTKATKDNSILFRLLDGFGLPNGAVKDANNIQGLPGANNLQFNFGNLNGPSQDPELARIANEYLRRRAELALEQSRRFGLPGEQRQLDTLPAPPTPEPGANGASNGREQH